MKSLVKLVTILLIATAAFAVSDVAVAGQKNEKQNEKDAEVLHRAIRQKYASGQEEGLNVVVYKYENGEANPVNPANHAFKKGDQIKIEFQSNFDGYVYFINVPPKGEKAVFYPDAKFGNNNIIRARQRYILPRDTIFEFEDDQTGMEVIQVVLSRQPVPFLEDAIRNSNGIIATTAEGAAAEFKEVSSSQGGFTVENPVKVIPDKQAAVLTRSVRLAPPKDKDKEGAVVTVPDKLKPGEVAVFEIRLRRI